MKRADLAHIPPPPLGDDGRLLPYTIPLLPEFNLTAQAETDGRWGADRAPIWCLIRRGGARGAQLGNVRWDCEAAEVVATWGRGVYFVDVRDLGGAVVTQGMANLGEGATGPQAGVLSNLAEPAPAPPVPAPAAPVPDLGDGIELTQLRQDLGVLGQGLAQLLRLQGQRPPDARDRPATLADLQMLVQQRPAQVASPMAQLGEMTAVMASLQSLTPTPPPPPAQVSPTAQLSELLGLMGQVREASAHDDGATNAADAANKFLGDLPSAVREIVRATDDGAPAPAQGGLDALVYMMDQCGNDPASVGVMLARQVQMGQLPAAWLQGAVLEQAATALGGERALCLKGAAMHARQILAAAADDDGQEQAG